MSDSFALAAGMFAVAVPLYIEQLRERGGPKKADYERAAALSEALGGPGGEDLLFKSKKPGRTAALFNETARAIAVLAYCPGGITIFGSHFDANDEFRRRGDAAAGREEGEGEGDPPGAGETDGGRL